MSLASWFLDAMRKNKEFRRRVNACNHPRESWKTQQVGLDWEVRCGVCGIYLGRPDDNCAGV